MCQVRTFNESDDQFIGPLFHVNYFALMDCNWFPRIVFAFLVVVLVLFLKSTADEFLSGALTVICEILELSQDVAGATFLAFGNGAPDVFSTLAAFTKGSGGSNADLGLGSLLGGISFVTTVVLGSVILSTKEEIPVYFETFGRDVLFLIVAVLWLAGLHLHGGGASIGVGILFLLLYAIYVILVVYQSRVFRRQKCWNDDPDADEPLISLVHVTSEIEAQHQQQVVIPASPLLPSESHQPINIRVVEENYFRAPARVETEQQVDETSNALEQRMKTCRDYAVFQDLYWRQLRIRQRAIRYGARTSMELLEMNWFFRMISVIQMPLGFLRALTVPLPESESWSRSIIALHPPFCSVFVIYVTSYGTEAYGIAMAIVIPVSIVVSLVLYFSMHETKPPTSRFARLAFALVSFIMCVVWIYAVAAEIVALFNSFGTVFGANSSIMGLSFLAWGNSIGDLVTNIAIARGGMPAMGVAACVASPVFNALFGLGASLTVVASKQYPAHVPINLDKFTIAAVILLLIVLSMTLIFARLRDYRLNRCLGLFLLFSYAVYMVVMGIVSTFHVG